MLEVRNLTKRYGSHTAVNNLSFTVETGRIYGFLGPNGAGKSTTMNIITGCLAATEGQVKVGGHDIFEEPLEAKRRIGYLPEQPPLYLDMTPEEYLYFVGEAKGLNRDQIRRQSDEAMARTGLLSVRRRLIKHLSKGYRQRVGLAQAILGNPELIILDEPTVGLDPKQIIEIRDLILDLKERHTVILSSHILSEVSAVCDDVMIISKGNIVAVDTPENLSRRLMGSSTLRLTVRGNEEAVRAAIEGLEGIRELTFHGEAGEGTVEVSIVTDRDRDIREDVFYALSEVRRPILAMSLASVSLEEVFLELTSDKASAEGTEAVQKEESQDEGNI